MMNKFARAWVMRNCKFAAPAGGKAGEWITESPKLGPTKQDIAAAQAKVPSQRQPDDWRKIIEADINKKYGIDPSKPRGSVVGSAEAVADMWKRNSNSYTEWTRTFANTEWGKIFGKIIEDAGMEKGSADLDGVISYLMTSGLKFDPVEPQAEQEPAPAAPTAAQESVEPEKQLGAPMQKPKNAWTTHVKLDPSNGEPIGWGGQQDMQRHMTQFPHLYQQQAQACRVSVRFKFA
jgi:hypothetical protein